MEVAIVLVILTVLFTIVGVPLASQMEARHRDDTQKILETARDALYGFAAANGRLPCPATAVSAGEESPKATAGSAACTTQVGFLPAVTLGILPLDASGFAVDGWADGTSAHRIGYAVSNTVVATIVPLTTTDGIKTATMNSTAGAADYLYVCATGLAAGPPTSNCGAAVVLTKSAPAVLFSLGKNSNINSIDEANNQNGDKTFSSGTPTSNFDDIVIWLSMNTLFDRMVKAGRLP